MTYTFACCCCKTTIHAGVPAPWSWVDGGTLSRLSTRWLKHPSTTPATAYRTYPAAALRAMAPARRRLPFYTAVWWRGAACPLPLCLPVPPSSHSHCACALCPPLRHLHDSDKHYLLHLIPHSLNHSILLLCEVGLGVIQCLLNAITLASW